MVSRGIRVFATVMVLASCSQGAPGGAPSGPDGDKIVLTGDPYQIDNPYVDSTSNGLVHVVNKFKLERLAGHITLTKGERSALAELASNVL